MGQDKQSKTEDNNFFTPSQERNGYSIVQPKVVSKIKPFIQPKAGPHTAAWKSNLNKRESIGDTSGKMSEVVQAKMENSFGQDFSDVTIHKDSSSAQNINAKAYTQGNDIHFAPGEYNPSSKEGQELLGHELTHVVQQGQGKVGAGEVHGKGMVINQDIRLEKEADEMGRLASEGQSIGMINGNSNNIQRKEKDLACEVGDWAYRVTKDKKGVLLPGATSPDKETTEQIEKNRTQVPDHSAKLKPNKHGQYYNGTNPSEKPSELTQANSKIKQKILDVIWAEIGHEGGLSSINTYDSEIFTWGKGFSGKSFLDDVIDNLVTLNKTFKSMFMGMGIYFSGGTMIAMNTNKGDRYGIIEVGEDALRLIKNDNRLLSFFIELAENDNTKSDVLSAQWKTIRDAAGKIPSYIHDDQNSFKDNWNEGTVALTCHLSHWLSGASWHYTSYQETKGDALNIVIKFINREIDLCQKLPNGSWLFKYGPPFKSHFSEYGAGGGAKGLAETAIKAASNCYQLSPAVLEAHPDLKDFILIKNDSKNEYYGIPKKMNENVSSYTTKFDKVATTVKGSNGFHDIYNSIQGLSIQDMIEKNIMKYSSDAFKELNEKLTETSDESVEHKADRQKYRSSFGPRLEIVMQAGAILKNHKVKDINTFKALSKAQKESLWLDAASLISKTEYIALEDNIGKIYLEQYFKKQ
jgi:hypothetical protein